MTIDVIEASRSALVEYAAIPIAFEVRTVLDVHDDATGQWRLAERALRAPYLKDYDALDENPAEWPNRFDTSRWGLLIARRDGQCVGGAVIAYDTPDIEMLEGRSDLAALWDIRVRPELRRRGVGTALFAAAETWAMAQGCRALKVETQNVNVGACRFYARRGCVLRMVRRGVYPLCPDEVQMLWQKDLRTGDGAGRNR